MCGVNRPIRFTPEPEFAGVGGIGAGDDVDQRRLARAVLAEQDVDLAGPKVEVDAVERDHAGEELRYPGQFQQQAVAARRSSGARRIPDAGFGGGHDLLRPAPVI